MNQRYENDSICYYETGQFAVWWILERLTYNLLYNAHDWLKARNKYEYFIQNKQAKYTQETMNLNWNFITVIWSYWHSFVSWLSSKSVLETIRTN